MELSDKWLDEQYPNKTEGDTPVWGIGRNVFGEGVFILKQVSSVDEDWVMYYYCLGDDLIWLHIVKTTDEVISLNKALMIS